MEADALQRRLYDETIHVDRAGPATWHGPGQAIVYPVVVLKQPIDLHAWIRSVENGVIRALHDLMSAGFSLVTITQYLRPPPLHHPVARRAPRIVPDCYGRRGCERCERRAARLNK